MDKIDDAIGLLKDIKSDIDETFVGDNKIVIEFILQELTKIKNGEYVPKKDVEEKMRQVLNSYKMKTDRPENKINKLKYLIELHLERDNTSKGFAGSCVDHKQYMIDTLTEAIMSELDNK